MKTKHLSLIAALLAVAALPLAAQQEDKEVTLKVGDPAPKLQTGKWVQGEPVTAFARDKVYLVEFWATWCGPCRQTIPHLNDLHTKFKDKGLVVIGQNVWERDESQVEPFVKKMGEKMTYRVAMDDKQGSEKGKMAETWMEAAGQNGIPAAFLVDKQGKIAWLGHPMGLKEEQIEEVLAGKHDLKKAVAEYEKEQKYKTEMTRLSRQFGQQMQNEEWDKAEATLNEVEKILPEDRRGGLDLTRLQILLSKGDRPGAAKLTEKISSGDANNAMLQNRLAWMLASQKELAEPLLGAAAKAAERANEAAKGKDASILDTLARVRFLQGKKEEAVRLQEKALEIAEPAMKKDLEETLASYKAGKLPDVQ